MLSSGAILMDFLEKGWLQQSRESTGEYNEREAR